MGSYPPFLDKGADGWPFSALGWGGASRRPQWSSMLSHGVHFSSPLKETADGGGGVAYNKKVLEILTSPPLQHPNAQSPLAH